MSERSQRPGCFLTLGVPFVLVMGLISVLA